MVFASFVTKTISFGDEGSVVIRKLSAKSLEKAAQQKSIEVSGMTKALGGELFRALQDVPASARKQQSPEEVRYNNYDRFSVLTAGIKSWTFEPKCDQDGINDLDEETADVLYKGIIDLSLPPIDPKKAEEVLSKD